MTEKIRRKPYSVVLFDEIEKAHPEVFNMLLQILDEGRITDSLGNRVDFRNTILILTSNIGTEHLSNKGNLGFSDNLVDNDKNKEYVMSELKQYFKPEFLNRIDEIVVFNTLKNEVLEEIVEKMIEELNETLSLKGISFKLAPGVRKYIVDNGFDQKYGARSLYRAISKFIEIPATDKLLSENIDLNKDIGIIEIRASLKKSGVSFQISQKGLDNSRKNIKKNEDVFDTAE